MPYHEAAARRSPVVCRKARPRGAGEWNCKELREAMVVYWLDNRASPRPTWRLALTVESRFYVSRCVEYFVTRKAQLARPDAQSSVERTHETALPPKDDT